MNTRSTITNGSDSYGTGSKVILWDEERSGTTHRDQVEVGLGQFRMSVLPTQDTNGNQTHDSHGAPRTRSQIPDRDGDISGGNTGQESRSLLQPQHHVLPGLMVGQGNMNSLHPRSGSGFGVEHIQQSYNMDQAPQSRTVATNVNPEMSNSEIFRDVTSPKSQHGSSSDHQTLETGNRDQLDDPTQLQMGVDDDCVGDETGNRDQLDDPTQQQMGVDDDYVGDETGCDLPSICSQFTTLTVGSRGSSVIQTDSSSGYHSPMRSEPLDSSNFCRPGRSAAGQSSGRGEAVSSFGQQGQEYNPSDVDSHHSIPSHCLMDPLGPPLEESRKKPRKTSENRGSGTSSRRTDQVIYKRTDGGAGMERPSPSGATQGHVRSSHGDREAIATHKHPKQRKKLKKEPYPAEVDDHMKKKMEAIMPMFTERVDPGLLQLHLRGCLKDYQCEHIRNQSDVKPRPYVNQTLWNYLKRAPYWWQNLERALEKCGYNELLAKLKEE